MILQSKNISIEETKEGEVEISAELPKEVMDEYFKKVLKDAGENTEIKGFRKGKVPEDVVREHLGDGELMKKAGEMALSDEYPSILAENKIQAIGKPEITITKIALGEALGFKIKTTVMPKIEIGDYKKISEKIIKKDNESSAPEITDEEVNESLENIARSKALEEKYKAGEKISPNDLKDEDIPKITDEFAKSLGDFKDLSDLKEKTKEYLKNEKIQKEKDKRRNEIIEEIIKSSEIPVPDLLINSELDKMIYQLKEDVSKSGIEFEEYLKHIKKSEDEIRSEWKDNAKKRAQTQLLLNHIAEKENILPDEDVVERESKHLIEHYNEADPERVKVFVETQVVNEKVIAFLEGK